MLVDVGGFVVVRGGGCDRRGIALQGVNAGDAGDSHDQRRSELRGKQRMCFSHGGCLNSMTE